jgi:hypothetical protein
MGKIFALLIFAVTLCAVAGALQQEGAAGKPDSAEADSGRIGKINETPRPRLSFGDRTPPVLSVAVDAPQEGDLLTIRVNPSSIKAQPSTFQLPASSQESSRSFTLEPPAGKQLSGEIEVEAELTRPSATGRPGVRLDGMTIQITAASGISLSIYFALGVLGIVIGYVLRLFMKALAATTPPALAPAPGQGQGKGKLSQFVEKYYYWIDCFVTAAIGFLVLVSLVQDGQPPENGAAWYSALAVGVGLGLLTNSELLLKAPGR